MGKRPESSWTPGDSERSESKRDEASGLSLCLIIVINKMYSSHSITRTILVTEIRYKWAD